MDLAVAAGLKAEDGRILVVGLKNILDATMEWAHQHFTYVPDSERFAVLEHWVTRAEIEADLSIGNLRKDCDGFAMLCREILNDAGVANRLVFCRINMPPPNGHAVLEVGGWVLDCRSNIVMPKDMLPYKWISISGEKPGEPWKEIA